jgi:hypothetical protein
MRKWTALVLGIMFLSVAAASAQTVAQEGKTWLDRNAQPAEMNVNGAWQSEDWGELKLEQAEGSRDLTGTGDKWDITGVAGGTTAFLVFHDKKGKIAYSAELSAEGEKTLKGRYSKKLMTESSKNKPMLLTR